MARFFVVVCSLLAFCLIVVAFASPKRVQYLEGKMPYLMYEDIKGRESDKISPTLNQIVVHRIVCAEEEVMEKRSLPCTSRYINDVFAVAKNSNATGSERTKLVQCIRRCPIIYKICKDTDDKSHDCPEMETMCLEYCMEHQWRKYGGIHEYAIW